MQTTDTAALNAASTRKVSRGRRFDRFTTMRKTTFARGAACAAIAVSLGGCALFGGGDPPPTPAEIAARTENSERIRREVEARLAAEPSIGPGRVRVEVQGADVSLHGPVAGLGALRCAISNADLVRGVSTVVDKMVLEPGPSTVRCLAPRAAPAVAGG